MIKALKTVFIIISRRNFATASSEKLEEELSSGWMRYLSPQKNVHLPYNHTCQIGDPVLRQKAMPVELSDIKTKEFLKLTQHLISVMRNYQAYGMSAPQIGLPVQIFVIETTKKELEDPLTIRHAGQPMDEIPLRVFVNPTMKILDFNTTEYPEVCASVCSFSAHVPRAKKIRIEALDEHGVPFTWEASGWAAKVAQHEYDHLQGILYIDKMNPKTFACTAWDAVNRKGGKLSIDYYPFRSKWRKFFFR